MEILNEDFEDRIVLIVSDWYWTNSKEDEADVRLTMIEVRTRSTTVNWNTLIDLYLKLAKSFHRFCSVDFDYCSFENCIDDDYVGDVIVQLIVDL